MQLTKEQLLKVDFAVERYLDEKEKCIYYIPSKSTVIINSYLNELSVSEYELLITVYFNLERIPSEEEKKTLENHKVNIFNLLVGKTKLEKKIKHFVNTDKIVKLKRYGKLVNKLNSLNKKCEKLQDKKNRNSNVSIVDYTKTRVSCTYGGYELDNLKIISDIDEITKEIRRCELELNKERDYLLNEFKSLTLSSSKKIFYLRYIQLKDWDYISKYLNISVESCLKNHDMYISLLNLQKERKNER